MKKFFSGLIFRKVVTEEEIINQWLNSGHNIKDYENLINYFPDNNYEYKLNFIIKEYQTVKVNSINELLNLKILLTKLINLAKNNNKLFTIIKRIFDSQMFFIDYFKLNDSFNSDLIQLNQHELLITILNSENFNQNINNLLYDYYFNKNNYLNIVKATCNKINKNNKELNALAWLLPNKVNINILKENKAIKQILQYENIFSDKRELNKKYDELNNAYFNIILNCEEYTNIILSQYDLINKNNSIDLIQIILIYNLYNKIFHLRKIIIKNNLYNFCNKSIQSLFNKKLIQEMLLLSKEDFSIIIDNLFNIITKIKENNNHKELINKVITIPIAILNIILNEISSVQFLTIYLKFLFDFFSYDEKQIIKLKNFIINFLFEKYSNDSKNNLLLLDLIIHNNNLFNFDFLSNELKNDITFIQILETQKINISLIDIIKSKYLQNNIELHLYKFFETITKKFKYSQFNFINSTTEKDFVFILEYVKNIKHNLVDHIINFLIKTENEKNILKIFLQNEFLLNLLTEDIIEKIVNIHIERKNKIIDSEINEYANDIKIFINNQRIKKVITSNFLHKCKNIISLFEVKKVFNDNQIDSTFLNELNYEQINNEMNTILEIFIKQKFNIEQIDNINQFLERTNDIYKALNNEQLEYMNNLFIIFNKYQNERLCYQIIELLLRSKDTNSSKYSEKCLYYLFKHNLNSYNTLLTDNNIKIMIIERISSFNNLELNLIDLIDLNKDYQIRFNMQNTNIFSSLIMKDKQEVSESINKSFFWDESKSFIKDKFVSMINNMRNDNIVVSNRNIVKYSMHGKLIQILKANNLDYKDKEFKFNTKIMFKSRLYRYLLKNNLIDINLICEFENFDTKNDKAFFDIIKLMMNTYYNELEEKFNFFIQEIKSNEKIINNKNKLTFDLVEFNLINVKVFNIDHFIFLDKIFDYRIQKPDNYYYYINNLCKREFNILPFLREYSKFVNDYNVKNLLFNYFNDLDNVCYFFKEKINSENLQIKSIYKIISLSNFKVLEKALFSGGIKIYNITFILIIKLVNNFPVIFNMNTPLMSKSTCNEILNITKTIILNDKELTYICFEILFLPHFNYLIESQRNILLLDKNSDKLLLDYFLCKLLLLETLFLSSEYNNYNYFFKKSFFIQDQFKIFKIKHFIIQTINDENKIDYYNKICNIKEYSLFRELKLSNKITKEIEKIYTENYN